MFDFSNVTLDKMVIHKVGNKLRDEGVCVSPASFSMKDSNVEELLLMYFLNSFKGKSSFKFFDEDGICSKFMYLCIEKIFADDSTFYSESVNVLKHLYEKSTHPQIRGGEFYMVYFRDCILGDRQADAIGIFKTEKKDTYLKVSNYGNEFIVGSEKCIDIKKLDKGCIVFNINAADGYRIAIVDNAKKGNESEFYWKDEFLKVADVHDNYFHTETCLTVCQDFVENIYGEIYQADRKDKVILINDAVTYFDTHSHFNIEDFAQEVIKEPELIEQFKEHKQNYDINMGLQPVDQFDISNPAVKSMKRKFKNLIKLDTEFEIKVKNSSIDGGNMQYIERGFDEEKGMSFYKVFFNVEE